MVNPDSIPRYQQPIYEDEECELRTCFDCKLLQKFGRMDTITLMGQLTPYSTIRHDRYQKKAVEDMISRCGWCPVQLCIMSCTDVPCERFKGDAE